MQYLPIEGLAAFNKATAELLLGADNPVIKENRVTASTLFNPDDNVFCEFIVLGSVVHSGSPELHLMVLYETPLSNILLY